MTALATEGPAYRKYLVENGPGMAVSVALHGIALLLLLTFVRQVSHPPDADLRTVLVDIIHLGTETTSPPSPQKSTMPQQEAHARRAPLAHSPPTGYAPNKTQPLDDLENHLNALSKLRQPETDTRVLQGTGEQRADSTSNDAAPGNDAAYALRDYVRAQIERRWNLDLGVLGTQKIIVALRVVMKSNGTITTAEIVDKQRYKTDAAYRQIAMSARNAILLASPIALPAGTYPAETEMTLRLDPRDALR